MNNSLPYWLQITTNIATPAIAFAVFVVALRQWRTANYKLVLDLFEKRYKIYRELQSVIAIMIGEQGKRHEKEDEFRKLVQEARFLFGADFTLYLYDVQQKLLQISTSEILSARRDATQEEMDEIKSNINDGYRFFIDHIEQFPRVAEPYLRMNQKLTPSLWQRWEDFRRPKAPFKFRALYPTQAHLQVPVGSRAFIAENLKRYRAVVSRSFPKFDGTAPDSETPP